MLSAANYQTISSRLEYQKSKENDQLKDYEPETLTCECHMESGEMSWGRKDADTTERLN